MFTTFSGVPVLSKPTNYLRVILDDHNFPGIDARRLFGDGIHLLTQTAATKRGKHRLTNLVHLEAGAWREAIVDSAVE